jgi:hypothetical protein
MVDGTAKKDVVTKLMKLVMFALVVPTLGVWGCSGPKTATTSGKMTDQVTKVGGGER